jgi:hypothetical protein
MSINEDIFNPIEPKRKPLPKDKVNAEKEYPHMVDCSNKRSFIGDVNEHALFADGFDEAIMGYDAAAYRVVYDYDKCMEVLRERDGIDLHEAHEFMEFNVVGAFVGDFTPLFIHTLMRIDHD